jgi:hypothetical protein
LTDPANILRKQRLEERLEYAGVALRLSQDHRNYLVQQKQPAGDIIFADKDVQSKADQYQSIKRELEKHLASMKRSQGVAF